MDNPAVATGLVRCPILLLLNHCHVGVREVLDKAIGHRQPDDPTTNDEVTRRCRHGYTVITPQIKENDAERHCPWTAHRW